MKKLMIATGTLIASAGAAFAADPNCQFTNSCAVPEISALEGTAALAAIAAVVLLAWERSRRAA